MTDEPLYENRGTILVVDDTPASVGMLQAALEQENYQVLIATSGEKALERINLINPDLILLDIMMPGIDGYETCLQLKSNAKTRDVPIIFLSALSETFDKVRAFSIGGVDYLTKPVEPEELLVRVKTHIRINQLERELQIANDELKNRVAVKNSEISQVHEKLSEKEEILHGIFSLSPLGIGVIDSHGKITDSNPAWNLFFGVEQTSDLTRYDFFSDPNISNHIMSRIKKGEQIEVEGIYDFDRLRTKVMGISKKGSRYFQMQISPLHEIHSTANSGYILFIQDITDWKLRMRGQHSSVSHEDVS